MIQVRILISCHAISFLVRNSLNIVCLRCWGHSTNVIAGHSENSIILEATHKGRPANPSGGGSQNRAITGHGLGEVNDIRTSENQKKYCVFVFFDKFMRKYTL